MVTSAELEEGGAMTDAIVASNLASKTPIHSQADACRPKEAIQLNSLVQGGPKIRYLSAQCISSIRQIIKSSSPDLNPLDYHILGTMLEKYYKLQPKHKTTDEMKVALQIIWEEMPREHVNKAVAIFMEC